MRVTVLLNPSAGVAAAARGTGLAQRVEALFGRRGVEARIVPVEPGRLFEQVGEALGSDAVLVGGGDGTAGSVAGLLAGGTTPLGVLPLGTFNHFARDLGMPAGLEAAVDALARAQVREIDVGEVNGRVFVNNASLGLYPSALASRDALGRPGRPRWRAMGRASLGVLLRYPLMRVRLQAGGRVIERTTPFVFVGNNRYDFTLLRARRRRLDEGWLYAYVAGRRSRLGLLLLAERTFAGRLERARDLDLFRAAALSVELPGVAAVRVALDGEAVRMQLPLRFRVRPRALRVLGP